MKVMSVPSQAVRDRSISQEQLTDDQKVKRLEAVYIGECDVMGSHGIKAINESVMKLSRDKTKWISVYVDVATSHIKIINREDNVTLKEHRIRFLSFLGIAQDDKFCGYVIDHGDNQFVFHGFYCRPNCDRLCLALHSACQSRYQKVIDSSTTPTDEQTDDTNIAPRKKSILKRIGSWKKKEVHEDTSSTKSECQNFVVQFLGSEVVSKSKGVDAVMGPLQKVSMKTSGIHLVELIVTPGGFTINDPQIKSFASKQIPTKKVTFCIRIRSNFVFVAKEGTKHVCYMFKESEVDTASIAQAVHDIMSS
jgi:amyloid beta (A4) precursor protein-binding family B protein 2 (Fe65-like)